MRTSKGFTLLELLLALAIGAVLAALATNSYQRYRERVDLALAIADITTISQLLERYYVVHGSFPASLEEAKIGLFDPWGNPYQYTNIALAKGKGDLRKDKNLVPINTDYDLFSAGKDGQSRSPLTAKVSQDDIIRANNGSYIGLAGDF
ncbi:prepilin-type N-terminal cleavage/methylation domain-containing protein [Halioxenophilus sp. WMMB6]|uniref:prepilin-type N-terminal cleavage/methylation domain-containing protein n=1 Tax=Halioxenophilus sp. WMMB6 TaxID=3073815 RepID=UPI00295F20BA|nr:prepilin-type N-terminal cleavage/methylation domain-containing protein [Halioxenophilus sp. WMMB6]